MLVSESWAGGGFWWRSVKVPMLVLLFLCPSHIYICHMIHLMDWDCTYAASMRAVMQSQGTSFFSPNTLLTLFSIRNLHTCDWQVLYVRSCRLFQLHESQLTPNTCTDILCVCPPVTCHLHPGDISPFSFFFLWHCRQPGRWELVLTSPGAFS